MTFEKLKFDLGRWGTRRMQTLKPDLNDWSCFEGQMSIDKNHPDLATISTPPSEKRPNWVDQRLKFPFIQYTQPELAEQCRKLGRASTNEEYEGFMLEVAERLEDGSAHLD